jgi:hypothetical protein
MSNLEFELWWVGDTTIHLTAQPQVGSLINGILKVQEYEEP